MRLLVRFAPRAGADFDPLLDQQIDADEILIGRSARCAIRLAHEDVRFEHACVRATADGPRIVALDAPAQEGAAMRIGPYTLALLPGGDGQAVLTVIPDAIPAPDEAALAGWYRKAFDATLPNVRLIGFALSVVIAALFFILPLAFAPAHFSAPWNVGRFSAVHHGFAGDCTHCHKVAFQHVPSSACLTCHAGIGQHADPAVAPAADLNKERCETCHREHKGAVLATADKQSDCVACHGAIKGWSPTSQQPDIHDFATDHPDFAPALVQDAVLRITRRVPLGSGDSADHSGVKFTHAKHLALDPLKAKGEGACSTCHVPQAGGVTFRPVTFDVNCASCHKLQFEPRHPEWKLPHGHPEEVSGRIAGFYARAALVGESFAPPASDLFARPGAPLPPPALQGTELVSSQTAAAMMSSIARSACGQCHTVFPPGAGEPDDRWTVAAVYVPELYEPRAVFSHARHETTTCATCHAAAKSDGGPLALLPGIVTCRLCHAGAAPVAQRVASPCATCHIFHDPSLSRISAPVPAASQGRNPARLP